MAENTPLGSDTENSERNHNLNSRNSLPPTANAKLDRQMLKALLAKSNFDMDKCIERGEVPAFGFPVVCFSPIADNSGVSDKEKFW